jgi:hypothetical protein
MPGRAWAIRIWTTPWLLWAMIWAVSSAAVGQQDAARCPVAVSAWFTGPGADGRAELYVAADLHSDFHVYSLTQPPGGPNRSQIKLAPSNAYRVIGDFVATTSPRVSSDLRVFGGLPMEEHRCRAMWHVTIELAPGIGPAELTIQGSLWAQADNDVQQYCLPPTDYAFTATLSRGPAADCACVPRRRLCWILAGIRERVACRRNRPSA